MLRPRFAAALALLFAAPLIAQGYEDVDPFIGTGGEGHTFPGAVAPFGMVQLSPDTDTGCVIRECYDHGPRAIATKTRRSRASRTPIFRAPGHSDLGDFLVMPVSGDAVPLEPGDPNKPGSGYRSRFSHTSENAQPGYYAVTLSDPGVRAEMTAGTRDRRPSLRLPRGRAGASGARPAQLALQLSGQDPVVVAPAAARRHDHRCRARRAAGRPARKLFFAMRFSAPLTDHAFINTRRGCRL